MSGHEVVFEPFVRALEPVGSMLEKRGYERDPLQDFGRECSVGFLRDGVAISFNCELGGPVWVMVTVPTPQSSQPAAEFPLGGMIQKRCPDQALPKFDWQWTPEAFEEYLAAIGQVLENEFPELLENTPDIGERYATEFGPRRR